jgi:thymidylate synthase
LRGDTDVAYLNENGIKIWNKDAYNWYKKHYSKNIVHQVDEMLSFEEFVQEVKEGKISGTVGQNYSAQWRDFNGVTDQIQNLIDDMKKNIMGSRLKVNAWNPSEVNETALPPCHSEFQVIGVPLENGEFGFELHWNQRSVDTFLGLPFNIASYGLLAKILEQITGYKALGIEGTLKCVHFYDNQYKSLDGQEKSVVEVLMERNSDEHPNCELKTLFSYKDSSLKSSLDDWLNILEIKDFVLDGYSAHDKLAVEMLAPKEV